MRAYDVIVIGGGVVGCAIARELSKYELSIAVLEKECDVGAGISGRNSGVAHAGFYVPSGTLKAELNVKGHRMLPFLCSDLGVPYEEIGKLVIAKDEKEIPYLETLKETGETNGSFGLEIISRDEIAKLEPEIEAVAALYSPKSAILDPFELTIALAENAQANGACFFLETEVVGIQKKDLFLVKTNKGDFSAKVVVNSAGLNSDEIAGMVGIDRYKIYPCRGEYHVLDKSNIKLLKHLVYPVPPKDIGGLGVHLTPTIHGNIMLGPSAEYLQEHDLATTCEVMDLLLREAREILPKIEKKHIIRSFAGVRPKLSPPGSKNPEDFVIEEDPEVEGFINLVGIESPGLTAAPAIAEKVAGLISTIELKPKKVFKPWRQARVHFASLSRDEQAALVEKDPDYGFVVCRCETVTKKEVLDALNNPLGVKNIDSIKRRCRAGMGRCQGGFCLPKIVEIMEEEGLSLSGMRLNCEGSELFVGRTKSLRKKR